MRLQADDRSMTAEACPLDKQPATSDRKLGKRTFTEHIVPVLGHQPDKIFHACLIASLEDAAARLHVRLHQGTFWARGFLPSENNRPLPAATHHQTLQQ